MELKLGDLTLYLQYNSVVILTLFFISFFVLILDKITRGKSNYLLFENYRSSLLSGFTYLRFFTHALGHSSWDHFAGNYITILLIGPMIEEKYGSLELLVMILITSFICGLVNFIIGKNRLRGASNILYMLIVLASFVNIEAGKIPITFVLIFIFYVIKEFRDVKKDDGISHTGHILGALCGMAFGFLYLNSLSIIDLIKCLF